MTVEKFCLEKHRLYLQQYLSKELLEDIQLSEDNACGLLILRMTKQIISHKLGDRLISFPSNWKEAFKERWFPDWAKGRWPVKRTEYDALAVFPNFLKDHPIPEPLKRDSYYFMYIDHRENPYKGTAHER